MKQETYLKISKSYLYKYLLLFTLIFSSIDCYSQTNPIKINPSKRDSLDLTIQIQNKSFLNDENNGSVDTSIHYARIALNNWISLNDTLNEANIRKYLGYIYGKNNQFIEGKLEIYKAIELYTYKNKDFGIAVSYYDLSKLFTYEKKYDSALIYIDKAINYWENKADTFRVLLNYNQKLNVLIQSKKFNEANNIQSKAETYLAKKNLHWRSILDFYYLSIEVQKRLKNKTKQKIYKELYTSKVQELNYKGIQVQSSYY